MGKVKLINSPHGIAPFNEDNTNMLVNCIYTKGYNEDTHEYSDILYIILKNVKTGEKSLKQIEHPTVPIYFEKPEYREHSTAERYKELTKLDKKVVPYTDIAKYIADDWGPDATRLYQSLLRNDDRNAVKDMLLYPYVFGADYAPDIVFRNTWLQKYGITNSAHYKLDVAYSDIETSLLNTHAEPDPSRDVIDLDTITDDEKKECHTFLFLFETLLHVDNETEDERKYREYLYSEKIKTQQWVLNHISEVEAMIYEELSEDYPDFKFILHPFTDELEMIQSAFRFINKRAFDMCLYWFMRFDMNYISDRIVALGGSPKKVICPEDFPIKQAQYIFDTIHMDAKTNNDRFVCTSRTAYLDQMGLYIKTRKSGSEIRFSALNYIAEKEGVGGKKDYSEEGDLLRLSCLNYIKYIIYNIKDTLVQRDLENVIHDTATLQTNSYMNASPYNDCFKETVTIRNGQYYYYWLQGLVPGVNTNSIIESKRRREEEAELKRRGIDPKTYKQDNKFEGAVVGNVALIDNVGQEILGKRSNCYFKYSADMDMKAFYPYTNIINNISAPSMHFKVIIPVNIFNCCKDRYGRRGNFVYNGITDHQIVETNPDFFRKGNDISKEIMDNLTTDNPLSFCHKWLNLPTIEDISSIIEEEIKDESK